MRLYFMAFILSVGVSYSTAAHADWQYTRWGQTLAELQSLRPDDIKLTDAKEQKDGEFPFGRPMAKTTYAAMNANFRVHFLFNNDELSGVALFLDDLQTASRIGSALMDQYGKPIKESASWDARKECRTVYRSWRDEQSGNNVSFRSWSCVDNTPGHFQVVYRPILDKKKTGL